MRVEGQVDEASEDAQTESTMSGKVITLRGS